MRKKCHWAVAGDVHDSFGSVGHRHCSAWARDGAGWSVRATHAGRCVAHAVIQGRDAHILEFVWFSVGCAHRGQGVVRQLAVRFAGRDLYARIL